MARNVEALYHASSGQAVIVTKVHRSTRARLLTALFPQPGHGPGAPLTKHRQTPCSHT